MIIYLKQYNCVQVSVNYQMEIIIRNNIVIDTIGILETIK